MTSSFTSTFSGSPINPADVAYAAYTFSISTALYWPQFANGQPNVAARFMNITTSVGGINISMPDATQASVGYDSIIFNSGSQPFNVVTFNGVAIVTISPGQTYYLIIENNSTDDGTWGTVQFGVGTGSANASALAGPGLMAASGLLQLNLDGIDVNSNFTLSSAGLAKFYVWTGGSGTISIPSAASVGNGFFFMVANNGSGSLTISPTGSTIDGGSTSVFSQSQSGFIVSDGTNWYTVGKGIQNTFSVTLLNLNVSGNSNVTETSAQAQNIIQVFTGTLTGNIAVIVPATVQLYEVNNSTSGAFSLTMKTPLGTGIVVPQGQTSILYCDGTNIINGLTASVTATFSLINGSASNPSLFFQSSPTTGFFSPGTSLVSITAGGNEVARFASQASAVNYLGFVSASTGNAVSIGASGSDSNISINIVPKGTGTTILGLLDDTIIGSHIPLAATFTSLTATTSVLGKVTATSLDGASIGASTPEGGAFTTLSASSTVSGSGFSTYLASPPSIGGTAAAAGTFTTLTATTITSTGNTTVDGNGRVEGTLEIDGITTAAKINATAINVSGLTASELVATDGSKNLTNVTALPAGTTAVTQAVNDRSTKVSTTAFANPAASLANPGYFELPSGWIIQTGTATTSSSISTPISFPISFPTSFVSGQVTFQSTGGGQFATYVSASTSGMSLDSWDTSGSRLAGTVSWMALGY